MMLSLLLSVLLQDISHPPQLSLDNRGIEHQQLKFNQLPESSERSYKVPVKKMVDGRESLGIEISGRSGIVVDVHTGTVLYSKEGHLQRPIASITKLMTALVFLDHNPGWEKEMVMLPADERVGAAAKIYRGEAVTVSDLFYASLVSSDNNATIALMRSTGLSESEFVRLMNEKSTEIGLKNTVFVEPTGLDQRNVSTALDISYLLYHSLQDPFIADATTRSVYSFDILNNEKTRNVYATDRLLDSYLNSSYTIKGGKTGFTYDAGSCLGIQIEDKDGNELIVVVLGSNNNQTRFTEVKALTEWTYDNFTW